MEKKGTHSCQIHSGLFGEHMKIKLSLDGPVTIELYANSKGFIS